MHASENAKKSVEGSEGGRTLAPPAPEAAFSPEGTAGAPSGGSGRAGCVCAVACALPWAEIALSPPRLRPRASEARRRGERGRAPRERLRSGRGPGAAPSEGCCARATNRQNQG